MPASDPRMTTHPSDDIEALRALSEAATPGEWYTGGTFDPYGPDPRTSIWGPTPPGAQSGTWVSKDIRIADAKLAVALVNAYRTGRITLASEPAQAGVPEGWRLVPVEPTAGMLDACGANKNGGLVTREYRTAIFKACVAAAPKPPRQDGLTIADYEEALADQRRLVREIDVTLNGEAGAAEQASLCDLVGQIRALKRAPHQDGWQPIETAPRDGTRVDLWRGSYRCPDAYWGRPDHTCGEAGRFCDCCPSYDGWCDLLGYVSGDEGHGADEPTHWRPLPAPPPEGDA